jgi:hypothetical protein
VQEALWSESEGLGGLRHRRGHYESLQVCYARGELDNEGIKGYLPEKRRRITFGEGATRLHLEE